MSRLRLRSLTDEEYDRIEELAGHSLDQCPTCLAKPIHVAPSVYGYENGTYRYRGEQYDCNCDIQRALHKAYLAANIGDQYQRLNWNDYDGPAEVRNAVSLYLSKWPTARVNGMGITFKGTQGSGKTFAATYIAKELIKRGVDVYFVPFVEVISAYKRQNADEFEEKLKQTGLLVLDELIPPEPGPQAVLFSRRYEELIRHRTNFNLPTIVTTNLNEEELQKHYPRTYSVLAAKQIPVDVKNDDARRGKIAIENIELLENEEVRPIT
jgi:DNA replication protein DnaC